MAAAKAAKPKAPAPKKRTSNRKRRSAHAGWPRLDYLVDALARYEELAVQAAAAGNFSAATKAKDSAVKVRAEIDQLRETIARADVPPDSEEHRAELLREVRRMRIGAQEAGSWVAASKLLEQEQDLLLKLEAERREREAEALAAANTDEVVEELVTLISTLPPALLDRVAEAIEARRESV